MKSEFPNPDAPAPGEAFVDAALREHARLGSHRADDGLVERILLETVEKKPSKNTSPELMIQRNRDVQKSWLIGATAVAAAAVLALVALQSFSVRSQTRSADEVHFVVTIIDPNSKGVEVAEATKRAPQLDVSPYERQFDIAFQEASPAGISSLSLPHYSLATSFGPSLETLPGTTHRHESFVISADKENKEDDLLVYEGNVVISHESFEIKASLASVTKAGTQVEPGASLTASDVTVTQRGAARSVVASNLAFDPVSGALHLTDVKRLVSGSDELIDFAPEDRVVLHRDSYTVENAPVVKYADPLLLRPEK